MKWARLDSTERSVVSMALPVSEMYKKMQVKTAPPTELLLMTYDVAIKSTERAIAAMKEGDGAEANRHLLKAEGAIDELNAALDFEVGGRVARNLSSLYDFIKSSMVKANIKKEVEPLLHCLRLLTDLRDTWAKAKAKLG